MHEQVRIFLEHLVQKDGRSKNTIAAYRNDLQQFVDFLNVELSPPLTAWSALSADVLRQYLSYLQNAELAYSSATVARKLAAVKRFCEYLYATKWIEENCARAVKLPKVVKSMPHIITTDEINKLLDAPRRHPTAQTLRDRALLETLYATGMRVSELVELNVDDVELDNDLTGGQIRCGVDARHRRVIRIHRQLAQVLAAYLNEGRPNVLTDRNEAALFLNHRGQRLTRQGLWLIIKRYVKQVDIKTTVTPHTLRHSFATHQLRSGAAPTDVQEQLGYASLASTQVYQQVVNGNAPELVIDGHPVVAVNGKH